MKRGLTLTIDSRSSRGNNINDVFSLRGFTKAFNKITEACNLYRQRCFGTSERRMAARS